MFSMIKLSLIPIASVILLFTGATISDAYAYIDPGSGSIIIQAIVGALVGVGITIRIYWYKIKEKLMKTPSSNE